MRIIISILIIAIGLSYSLVSESRKRLNQYIMICGILVFLQAAFRPMNLTDVHSSNDTIRYYMMFNQIKSISLLEVMNRFSFFATDYSDRDPGYSIVVKLFQYISNDFRLFVCFLVGSYIYPICKIIRHYSTSIISVTLSFLVYEALFSHFIETGFRQTLAMGIVFMSFDYVRQNDKWKFLLMIVLAYTIHSTALTFLPLIFCNYVHDYKRLLLLAFFLLPVLMNTITPLMAYIGSGTIYESYAVDSVYNQGTPVFSTLLILISVAYFYQYNQIRAIHDSKILTLAIFMGLILMPLSWIDSNFLRLTFYYTVFLVVSIPILIDSMCKSTRWRILVYDMVILFLLILMNKQ